MNALRRTQVLGDSLVATRVNAESDAWWAGMRPVVILAFIVFLMVRKMNRLIARRAPEPSPQAAPPAEPATTPEEIELLREIRDSLKRFG